VQNTQVHAVGRIRSIWLLKSRWFIRIVTSGLLTVEKPVVHTDSNQWAFDCWKAGGSYVSHHLLVITKLDHVWHNLYRAYAKENVFQMSVKLKTAKSCWEPGQDIYFSLLSVEAGVVPVEPTAYSVSSPVVTLPQHNADHSLPSTAEIKNECSYFFGPSYALIAFTGTPLRALPLPNSRG